MSSIPIECGAMALIQISSLLGFPQHPGRSIKGPICVVTAKGINMCYKSVSVGYLNIPSHLLLKKTSETLRLAQNITSSR